MWRLLSCFICSFLFILLWPSTSTFTYACDPGGKTSGLKYQDKIKIFDHYLEIQCKTGIIFPTRWCCPSQWRLL